MGLKYVHVYWTGPDFHDRVSFGRLDGYHDKDDGDRFRYLAVSDLSGWGDCITDGETDFSLYTGAGEVSDSHCLKEGNGVVTDSWLDTGVNVEGSVSSVRSRGTTNCVSVRREGGHDFDASRT